MSFPWILGTGFESGLHNFTALSGTLIDVAHYTELARAGMAPWRGSYALRIRLNGGTTSQFIRDNTSFDGWTANQSRFVRFYFYLGKDLVMTDTDKLTLFDAESVEDTTAEIACGILRNGGNIEFWVAETASATAQTKVLGTTTTALGKWYHAEINGDLDNAGANDGTIDAWIDDAAVGSQITALDQGVIVDGRFGAIGPDAGTSGTILIDDIIFDDTRVFKDTLQYRQPNAFVKFTNDHPIIGRGKFAVAFTDSDATDQSLTLYDSDGAPSNLEPIAVLYAPTANEFVPGHDIFEVTRGLWTVLSATTGQAFVSIEKGGLYSDGAIVARGRQQKAPSP